MIRVGVLRGGTTHTYNKSLASGAYVLKNLPKNIYEPVDIFVDKEGIWHLGGVPLNYDKLKHRVDVIWNSLHGFYGEDGKVQQVLENLGIPYVGESPFLSSVLMNKKMLKENLANINVNTPHGIYIENWGVEDKDKTLDYVVSNISQKLSPPWIVEPIFLGASYGPVRIPNTNELRITLEKAFDLQIPVLIEQAVLGKEIKVVSMNGFREKPIYTFLPVTKEGGVSRTYLYDSNRLQRIAENIHRELGFRQHSLIKMIVTKNGDVYVDGIESLPFTHEESDLMQAVSSVGSNFQEFSKHLISDALKNN